MKKKIYGWFVDNKGFEKVILLDGFVRVYRIIVRKPIKVEPSSIVGRRNYKQT